MTRLKLMLGVLLITAPAIAQYDLSWYTIDGGGQMFSTGGAYSLGGTIGQHDAGPTPLPMSGGAFELTGGFWVAAVDVCSCPGDLNGDNVRAGDDIQQFVACYLSVGPACDCADVNGNSMLDPGDVTTFVNMLLSSSVCP